MSFSRSSCLLLLLTISARMSQATDYYVSPSGSDSNAGTSSATPWASLSKASSATLNPGDRILLQRGAEFHGALTIYADGTEANPITVDAYGTGAKPKIWGSDVVNPSTFRYLAGSTYTYNSSQAVNSIFMDHQFFNSAALLNPTKNSDLSNIAYVKTHANTWYQAGDGKVYVNSGAVNPNTTASVFTQAVREDLINVHDSTNIVVRNIIADESAKDNAGYAFRTFQSENVTFENCEAYRAGKHHFGVINTKNFYGKDLYAAVTMPDQASASGFVSYSDARRTGDTSTWENIVGDHLYGGAFYCHGDPGALTKVVIKNIVAHGTGIGASMPPGTLEIHGGIVDQGANVALFTDESLVEGLQIGDNGYILIPGSRNIYQNLVVKHYSTNQRYYSVIDDHGRDNVVRFSTFDISQGNAAAITSVNSDTNTEIYGNIFNGSSIALQTYSLTDNGTRLHDNLYNGSYFALARNYTWNPLTPAQIASFGYDYHSIVGDPLFGNLSAGDLNLQGGSPAIGYINASTLANGPLVDFNGNPRGLTGYYNLGAFEGPVIIPEPALLLPAFSLLILRRRKHA